MLPPDADALYARSRLLRTLFENAQDDEFEALVGEAGDLVLDATCRTSWDDYTELEERRAFRAALLKTEEVAIAADPKRAKGAAEQAGAGGLRSISAGSWSESYFGPGDAAKAGRLSPNPLLHEVLWSLMGPACRSAFLSASGTIVPATAVSRPSLRSGLGRRRVGPY